MKQRKLVKKVNKACLDHNAEALYALRLKEFEKIIKHKQQGKAFSTKWTVVRF